MSNAARKARKRAGTPFVKAQKVGTPLLERAWFTSLVAGAHGTRHVGKVVPRSEGKNSKKARALKAFGIVTEEQK